LVNDRVQFLQLIEDHWRALFNFAFRMSLDRHRAGVVVEESYRRAYSKAADLPATATAELWLLKIAQHVLDRQLPRNPEVSWDILDDTLRSEATRTDVVRSLAEPERDFLLWELKQGCMTAVINCLSPGERSAFVLSNILRLDDPSAAAVLDISLSAFRVRLSRAQQKVTSYLAPRCEHIDPNNPCRCPARIGVALDKGFIRAAGQLRLRRPVEPFGRYGAGEGTEDAPLREVSAVYGNLPEPDPPESLGVRLRQLVESGSWD
jgi:DNA-directed RNA polymerase specialized sigma24 family protein